MSADTRIHVSLDHLRRLQGVGESLSFLPRQPSASVLNGRHASRLRGRGLNFEEMRGYLPGDDVRAIDWKATARTGSPYVRVFTEERDRPALLVVDQRMAMYFGSQLNMKSVTAAEAAAIAAFGIAHAGDRVGGIVFNDERQHDFTPHRGSRSIYAMLEAISDMNNELHADRQIADIPGGLNRVLRGVSRLAHHDHLVLVFSDFDGIDHLTERHLSTIATHNDLVLVLVHDPMAERLTLGERAVIGDGNLQAEVNLGASATRDAVSSFTRQRLQQIHAWQSRINLSVLPLSAGEETLPQLRRLMGLAAPGRGAR